MNYPIMGRLSVMMFLQFFVWGSWFVTVGQYMETHRMRDVIYLAYMVGPIAAILSPLFLGMVADRFFASERVLGVLHIVGGLIMLLAPLAGERSEPLQGVFILILLAHTLCYMPTLGLTNTLAFHNLTNQEKEFPFVRVFGTIGWIAANFLVSKQLQADTDALQFYLTGGAGIALGLYSFTLPHTPPPGKGQKTSVRQVLGLDAVALMRQPSFAVFILSSFLICIPLAAYYSYAPIFVNHAGFRDPAYTMSFGQWAEILFMLAMPLCFAYLGVKWMLVVGMFAWVARYALFAAGAPTPYYWMIVGGILLHGICYDFFFVTGFIYVDKKASRAIRGQAQGFLVLITQGLGMLIGAFVAGQIFNRIVVASGTEALPQWRTFWIVPCVFAGAVLLFFAVAFRDRIADDTNVTEGDVAKKKMTEELA